MGAVRLAFSTSILSESRPWAKQHVLLANIQILQIRKCLLMQYYAKSKLKGSYRDKQ